MRLAGWPRALAERMEKWRARPLVYGTSDCFQFAGDVVLALTGVDHRERFAYGSRRDALRILDQYGGAQGLITAMLGAPKPAHHARDGDLVAVDFGDGVTVGVCLGSYAWTPGPQGLVKVDASAAVAAWSV